MYILIPVYVYKDAFTMTSSNITLYLSSLMSSSEENLKVPALDILISVCNDAIINKYHAGIVIVI